MAITLRNALNSTDTQADVDGLLTRTAPFTAQIDSETVLVTGSSFRQASTGGWDTVQMERGHDGTTATAHDAAAELVPVALRMAANVAAIATPAEATAADAATAVNAVLTSLKAAGLMARDTEPA